MKKEIGKKKSNKIKAILIIGLMLFVTGSVVADQMQIFAKEETPLSPLGADADEAGIHIGGAESMPVNTVEINSDSDDTYLFNTNPVYLTAHDSATGTSNSDFHSVSVGQYILLIYIVSRGVLYFDTSSIPLGSEIISAKLTLVLSTDNSATDFDVVIQNGMPTYPSKPAVATDFLYSYYSGDGGSINTSALPAVGNPFDIDLNDIGLGWINKGGITKFMFRSSRDISSTPPTGLELIYFYAFDTGAPYIPKLTVEYTLTPIVHIRGGHIGGE